VEGNTKELDSGIEGPMEFERYCTAGGQRYCSVKSVCYSQHYVEGVAQQVDSVA